MQPGGPINNLVWPVYIIAGWSLQDLNLGLRSLSVNCNAIHTAQLNTLKGT